MLRACASNFKPPPGALTVAPEHGTRLCMELISFSSGDLTLKLSPDSEVRYPRVQANQLILCARMNDFERFSAMWQKKTEPAVWTEIENALATRTSQDRWKLKEGFARLATRDDEVASGTPTIVRQIEM